MPTKEKTIKVDELYQDSLTKDIVLIKDIAVAGSGYMFETYGIQIKLYSLIYNKHMNRIIYIFSKEEREKISLNEPPEKQKLIEMSWQNFNIMYKRI